MKQTIEETNKTTTNSEVTTTNRKRSKSFKPEDGILCKSITFGGLYMEGVKSHILYDWEEEGDETEVEYQDLLACVRSNSPYVMKPKFVIEDEDFVEQNPKLKEIYEKMYSVGELKDVILKLSVGNMKATIKSLPKGAQESLKHTASQLVSSGKLDSVQKIKALDEIFNTELMLMTGLM